ncbi:MAG: NAD(+)/NADH kinase [Candidatus Obscuribacterales bacterium]|nr:NAD(+)/NADH kinase [Candidatus Obscuribacterales bacterium]
MSHYRVPSYALKVAKKSAQSANLAIWIDIQPREALKIRKVLILHKKSTFQLQAVEHKEARFLKLLEEGNEVVARVKLAHEEHIETLNLLESELKRRKIEFHSVARAEITDWVTDYDLMMAVGGDGTFLDASHALHHVPLLGINSSSSSSFGHFCLGNQKNLTSILDQIQDDSLKASQLLRLQLTINGKLMPELILNEVLVSHKHPAATSRYFIDLHGEKEEQRSSGIWIGTPAGSTGSLRSAGGAVLPILDTRYQYVVREACMRPSEKWHLIRGLLSADESIHLVSQMRTGAIYADGQHIEYDFNLGDELIVRTSPNSLRAFVSANVNDIFSTNCR